MVTSLSQENEKILKNIQRNEFNQTESALVILSFEKNLKQKKELLKKKSEELARSEAEMADLNGQLSRLLEEVLRLEDQINTNRSVHANLISNLEKVELSLARKNQELNATSAENDSVGKRLADQQLELRKVEDMLLDAQVREEADLKAQSGKGDSDTQKLSAAEKKLKETIVRNVEREMTKLFQSAKLKEVQHRMEGKAEA